MKWRIFFIIPCFFIPVLLAFCAPSAEDDFRGACNFYEKGDYKAAIREYNKILDTGYESGELYYDLGNSYFKDGRLGMAVLSYERARNLMPRDGDLESNYRYVLNRLRHSAAPKPAILPFRIFNKLEFYFTVNEFAVFLSLLFFVFMAIVLSHFYFKWIRTYFVVMLAAILILFILAASLAVSKVLRVRREAVVVAKEIDSRFEPFERATTHFKLYEGSTVSVVGSKPPWYKVRRTDGKVGWVKSSGVERIKPQTKKAL